ncbi:hypothetical protein AYO50_00075 [Acidobacteria bacterium SCGC AG-212-P17]|nr:hypothetical protein AYO50_00075 [Acidobacteria bacterium SCGC AG-212-P17]
MKRIILAAGPGRQECRQRIDCAAHQKNRKDSKWKTRNASLMYASYTGEGEQGITESEIHGKAKQEPQKGGYPYPSC